MNIASIKNIRDKDTIFQLTKKLLIFPYNKLVSFIRNHHEATLIESVPAFQARCLKQLKEKKNIRCLFLVVFHQVWKCDEIYKLMEQNSRFEPVVVMCPRVNYGKETMKQSLKDGCDFFLKRGYNVVNSYDEIKDEYIDIKDLNPDIIFYTNPYRGLIDERYYITNFLDTLTIYVPYMFGNNNDVKSFHDQLLHNLVWRFYVESDMHEEDSKKYSRNHGRNVVNTGYPGIEHYVSLSYLPSNCDWKLSDRDIKRIIWAPHHTIQAVGNVNYSCFLKYADFMLEMADKYAERIQFVFKPHPLLRDKLNNLWGKIKTDNYYQQWESRYNCKVNDGFYEDLFLTSDAMIHDSGSFVVEYLYMNKPVMRTLNGIPVESMFNSFAMRCLAQYYMAQTEQDIEQFIQNVIGGVDPLKEQRTKFVNDVLMPNGSPSQNIINDILDSVDNQILYRN